MSRCFTRMTRIFCSCLLACICALPCPGAEAAPALTVISAAPKGEVRDLTQITVRFSEAMRPLGVMDEPAKTAPLALTAKTGNVPKGTFRWLDPATLAYIFDGPVDRPVAIRAVVPGGATALSGKTLAKDAAWDVSTPPLVLRLGNSPDEDLPRTKAVMYLLANYPLNAKLLKEKSRLTAGGKPLEFTLKSPEVYDHHGGRPSVWRYGFAVKAPLPRNSLVTLDIGAGVTAKGGGDPAGKSSFTLRGFGDLRLTSWAIDGKGSRGATGGTAKNPRPENRLYLYFNNPVRYNDLLGHVTVSPKAPVPGEREWDRTAAGSSFSLPFLWEPRTAYTVTIKPGLQDRFGTTLAKAETITFTTGDYRPFLEMPRGPVVMESSLAGIFPLVMRNAATVTASLRYLPWGKDAFALLRGRPLADDGAFTRFNGARETAAILETTDSPNKTLRKVLDIPAALGLPDKARGLILARLVSPEQGPGQDGLDEDLARLYTNRPLEAAIQVTDLGMAARLGDRKGLVWVTAIGSGKPLPGVALRLLDKDGASLWSGKTDENGLAVTPGLASLSAMPRFCLAESGPGSNNDAAVLDLGMSGIPEDKSAYEEHKQQAMPWQIHAVSQLSLYRPGQTVNATLYARQYTDAFGGKDRDFPSWLPVAGETLSVSVQDRNGKAVHSFEAKTSEYGSVPFSFTLSPQAEQGWYTVRAATKRFHYETGVTPFRVASFRPPEFKVDLTPPPAQPIPAERNKRLPVTVAAGYFSGALLPGGTVDMTVEYSDAYFTPPLLSGYTTGPDAYPFGRYSRSWRPETATVSGKLDGKGLVTLDLPSMDKSLRPKSLFMTATVTDASKLTSQGTGATLLHPAAVYVGLRAPFIAAKNKEAAFFLKAATWDNRPVTGKSVSLKAERVTWVNGDEKAETVWEKTVSLADKTGDRVTAVFGRSGQYRVTASIRDEENRENVAVTRVYVPGPDMGWAVARHGGRHDGGYLDFLGKEAAYKPGDTASFVIKNPPGKNPVDASVALIAIERDGVRRTMIQAVSGENPVIDIPLEKADAPYVFASIILVKGRTAPPPAAPDGKQQGEPVFDEGAPSLHQGSLLLRVNGAGPGLAVSVTTDEAEYRPGGTVSATATVKDRGKPQKAQVTFLAVDERVLRAGGEFTTYDPVQSFQPLYPNAVYGADLWRYLLKHHQLATGPDERLRAMKAEAPSPAQAMAEMRADAGNGQTPDVAIRRDFTPLAFWLAEGETDNNGVLSATFTLPDTLTSYRVVAVASDREDGFANAARSVWASKPLQLLPALPKFVTEGDTLLAGFLVQNTGAKRGTASVTLTASGAVFATPQGMTPEEQTRSITLEAGRSGLVTFPLRMAMLAAPTGEIRLRATGRMGKETDGAEYVLPVRPLRPVTTVAAAGLLGEGERYTLPVKAPANLDMRSRLDVTFAPSPAAGIPLAARQLVEYPWNCLEQRLSRAWARMIRLEHGSLIGLAADASDREAVRAEFGAVPGYQREDGSFGLWSGGSGPDEGGVNLFITAYALLVNHEGKGTGITLPEDVTAKALAYLEKTLGDLPAPRKKTAERTSGKQAGDWRPAPETYALALRVLAFDKPEAAASLFGPVLAFCEAEETNPLGWGALLLAMDKNTPDRDNVTKRILGNLEKTVAVTPTHMHFGSAYDNGYWRTLGSTLRDNAMILAAMPAGHPDYPRLEALAAWVGQRVGDAKTLSTQEAAFGLWGLTEYLRSLGGNRETHIRALWNGRDEASTAFSKLMQPPVTWSLPAAALNGGAASNLNLAALKAGPTGRRGLPTPPRTCP
ncbi:putative Alpha-2-macroglobulin domain protein [uncultured delta proteobacterium]|uniref:Putative Alpha-2-macroglobulin domain protein n=1 Tax=uncultured delta proteobacterium TaxID=34034 RepID=A0A212JPD5_9DELT|nr:putative Alpha-2-macroglobulin domain protein [uncultured delta proteobacterium]